MIRHRLATHAFEVAVMAMLVLFGVVGLTGRSPLLIAVGAMLFSWGIGWYAVLAAGAVLVLAAMVWPSALTGLYLERVGLAVVGWQLVSMGILVQFTADVLVRIDGLGCLLLAAGCMGRLARVTADLRELSRASAA